MDLLINNLIDAPPQDFVNSIKELDRKKEFIPLYKYLYEDDYTRLHQLKKKLMENDETLNIFASNFPDQIWIKVVSDYNFKSRIQKHLIPSILFAFSQSYDDIYYFIEYLEKAINEKDDDMVKGFYDIFMNNISQTQKSTMMIDSGNIDTARELLDKNYNEYSNEILKSLLSDYEGKKENKNVDEKIEESYEKNISSIEPVFKEILFDYVDSKEKLYGKKVVMFDKDKKYTMSYDYFIRNLIYSSYMFFKEGEKYYMGKFLADKLNVKDCFLPFMFVCRRKENVNIYEVWYGEEYDVDFDIRFDIALNDKKIIDDMITRINKCSYGFQPLGIGIVDKTGKISSGHAGFIFFEKIGNNVNIYYYEPHGTNEFTSLAFRLGMPEFFKYLVEQINKLYPELNVKIDFKYSGCLEGLQGYVTGDIGMCESWTFLWMFLVSKTLDYVKKNNLNLTIEEWLPLIEKYFTEEVKRREVYNLLVSFISQLYIEFNNENKAFNSHIKKQLREKYLKPKFIKGGFEEGIKIEDITGRETYELEKMKKEYKEYVSKLAVLKEDFLQRQEALKDVKRKIKEEEKKVSDKEGKKLFENCSYDLECSTKCCKTMGRTKICVPEKECKFRHIYGKGFTRNKK